jgi:hypothetical protein
MWVYKRMRRGGMCMGNQEGILGAGRGGGDVEKAGIGKKGMGHGKQKEKRDGTWKTKKGHTSFSSQRAAKFW